MKNSTIFLAFLILLSSPAKGQDFGKGLAALSKNDFATALSEWVPLANDGNTSAQYHLGIMYRNGKGVSKDYTEALKWFRLAAKQDNIDQHLKFVFMSSNINAQITLGKMYEDGQGVSQDYTEALKCISRLQIMTSLMLNTYRLWAMVSQKKSSDIEQPQTLQEQSSVLD